MCLLRLVSINQSVIVSHKCKKRQDSSKNTSCVQSVSRFLLLFFCFVVVVVVVVKISNVFGQEDDRG